jgi:hypothetical protein
LTKEWSPEQIVGRMKEQADGRCLSPQTIFVWIYRGP